MRLLLLTITSLTALTGCATAPPLSTSSAQVGQAVEAYKSCSWAALGPLKGTARPDPALQVATVAEGSCTAELLAVRAAVLAENSGHGQGAVFADSYTRSLRTRMVNTLAEELLKTR